MLQTGWSVLGTPQRCGGVPRYRSAMQVTDRSGTHLLGIKATGARIVYWLIFICFLFNEVSNNRVVSAHWIRSDVERMGPGLVWVLSYHLLGAAEENTKTFSAHRQSLDLRKPGVPPARTWRVESVALDVFLEGKDWRIVMLNIFLTLCWAEW
jgi:hypothetical protein